MEEARFSASSSIGIHDHSRLCCPVKGHSTLKETLTLLSETRKMKHSTLISMSERYPWM